MKYLISKNQNFKIEFISNLFKYYLIINYMIK